MREETLTVDCSGLRLDQFLARKFPGLSRAHLKDLILRGGVFVGGLVKPPDFRLAGGEVIRLHWPEPQWGQDFESWILHEDAQLLALNKPSGLITHPMGESWVSRPEAALSESEPSLAGLVLRHRPKAAGSGVSRCGLVHRLDRQTSGVMLVAKTPQAQERLLEEFRERRVLKIYRALVFGEADKTTVEAPIGRRPGSRRVQVTPWGKSASTRFRALGSARGVSLVEAQPLTGRTHQIRAHLALLKHPVLGDVEWFKEPHEAELNRLGAPKPPRMFLHAYRIRFAHPRSGKETQFTAPLPEDFKDFWSSLKGETPSS